MGHYLIDYSAGGPDKTNDTNAKFSQKILRKRKSKRKFKNTLRQITIKKNKHTNLWDAIKAVTEVLSDTGLL